MRTRRLQSFSLRRIFIVMLLSICLPLSLSGCASKNHDTKKNTDKVKEAIVLADGTWATIQLHNRLIGYIIQNGYGYPVEYLSGEELPLLRALAGNDIQIMMEVWTGDFPVEWKTMQKELKVKNMGTNYAGAVQGWFVPAYMIAGDVERGIEPVAPDLKYVSDLPRFGSLFAKNPSSQKSLLNNAPSTWVAADINRTKLKAYGLSSYYTLASTNSESDLTKSLLRYYEKGTPWLGYSRDPGLITAGQKMIMLREPPYDELLWQQHACAYPVTDVLIGANRSLENTAPELLDLLDKYETTYDQNIQLLQYLSKYAGNKNKAVIAFMKDKPDIWNAWVPDEVIKKVDTALAAEVVE
ncbi:MAG: ABC transporter substrate-binding protein [Syntrophomonadaceae bacterium]|nr:ABC transporter substrate-binding protein [Syntrophomonadaceae bacterium]